MAPPLQRAVTGARTRLARVRVRLTVVATALLAVGLALAAGVMLLVLHQSLLSTADGVTRARASEISCASDTTRGSIPDFASSMSDISTACSWWGTIICTNIASAALWLEDAAATDDDSVVEWPSCDDDPHPASAIAPPAARTAAVMEIRRALVGRVLIVVITPVSTGCVEGRSANHGDSMEIGRRTTTTSTDRRFAATMAS